MKPIHIKPAEEQMLAEILPLFEAQLREHDIDTPLSAFREVVRQVIADSRHGFILVAEAQGRPVGLAFVAAHLTVEHGGTLGRLEELYVLPEWRNSGLGGRLLRAVIDHAKMLGWRALTLEVVEGHERVIAFYQRHQFQPLPRSLFSRNFPSA